MQRNESLLETALELQRLDRVPRMGYLLRGVENGESVSEHSFHVAFLVWALAGQIDGIDRARALEIALVHDIAEVRFGDLPRTAAKYLPDGAKKQAEGAAIRDILAPLGPEAEALHEEYEAAVSPEAQLVKACDKLQLMIKVALYERDGAKGLTEFWGNPANFPDFAFEPVQELFEALRTWREGESTES